MHHDFITKEIFLNFMQSQMLSICNSEEIELRSVMIMNNARIHQSAKLDELCESFEMHLVKLSFYSFDYNFIESSFSVLKAWIKRNDKLVQWYDESNERFDEFLRVAVRSQSVTILACVTRKMLKKKMLNHLDDVEQYYKWW